MTAVPSLVGLAVVFQRDGGALGHGTAVGIFEGRTGECRKQIVECLARKFDPAPAKDSFRRQVGEGETKFAVEAHVRVLDGIEDDQALFRPHYLDFTECSRNELCVS